MLGINLLAIILKSAIPLYVFLGKVRSMDPFLFSTLIGKTDSPFKVIFKNYNQYYFSSTSSISKVNSNKPVYLLLASTTGMVSGTGNSIFWIFSDIIISPSH